METARALRILQEHLRYSDFNAARVVASVNLYLANEHGKTIADYPESWFPYLLHQAGEIGKVRLMLMIASDFTPTETPEELDAMLTQAFCDPDSLRVLRSLHEEDPDPH